MELYLFTFGYISVEIGTTQFADSIGTYIRKNGDYTLCSKSKGRYSLVVISTVDIKAITITGSDFCKLRKFPLAFLTAVTFGISNSSSYVDGRILTPVLEGILYRINGKSLTLAQA